MSHDAHPADRTSLRLVPVLGLFTAITITVGEVIGSGIFFKPKPVAEATGGHVGLILSLWVLCGIVNLCGALSLAELSAMMPHAGGCYVFLRETYGRLWAFLWAWAEFWVIRTGAIAALATAMAMSIENLYQLAGRATPLAAGWPFQTTVAAITIVVLAAINVVGARWGGRVQDLTTVLKVAFLMFLAALPFWGAAQRAVDPTPLWPDFSERSLWAGLGAALAGIMWAYDGWGGLTVVAEEIHNPQRNVPRALIIGLVLLVVLYTGANVGYHRTLTSAEIAASDTPAADVAEKLLPGWGRWLVLWALVVSTFGALNSNILIGPRVTYAMARDLTRLRWLDRVDPRTGTPAVAIVAIAGWAVALLVFSRISPHPEKRLYDVLTDYAIFGGSVFYFLSVLAVFVLRWRQPDAPRPYRAWGYPWTPLLFSVFYVGLLGLMFWSNTSESLTGLGFIGLGVVVHRWLR